MNIPTTFLWVVSNLQTYFLNAEKIYYSKEMTIYILASEVGWCRKELYKKYVRN